jgi:hypothetical protein
MMDEERAGEICSEHYASEKLAWKYYIERQTFDLGPNRVVVNVFFVEQQSWPIEFFLTSVLRWWSSSNSRI